MHADEIIVDIHQLRLILTEQFPQWAGFSLNRITSAGTDNVLYKLGDKLVLRMPRIESVVAQIKKEQKWLPILSPYLSLQTPVPVAMGKPAYQYPWNWSVYEWLDGETISPEIIDTHFAASLGNFVQSLRNVPITGGPLPGQHNSSRGEPLIKRNTVTLKAIHALKSIIDAQKVISCWENVLSIPEWSEPLVWIHGDLHGGNMLAVNNNLTSIIDFGCLGVGDPACDLMPAWNLLTAQTRETFRKATLVDDNTWSRGRGWALSVAVVALAYYINSNPFLANMSRYTIEEIFKDQ